jgi:hypothetical protein
MSSGGVEKGTECRRTELGHSVPGGYTYGDLALQVGGVSSLREKNMVTSSARIRMTALARANQTVCLLEVLK